MIQTSSSTQFKKLINQGRHEKARELLAKAALNNAIVPLQVLIELGNVCIRKLQLTASEITYI